MNQWPTTRATLLVSLSNEQHHAAWVEFAQVYEPVIYRFARKRGLQHADAAELTQQVLLKVMKSSQRWSDEDPPSYFRGWLKTVASNSLINLVTRESKYRAVGGSNEHAVSEPVADPAESSIWAEEEQRALLRQAAKNIRSEFSEDSWAAFELTLFQGKSIETVAQSLGKSKGAVYAARARIVRRLKHESAEMISAAEESL